MKTSGCVLAGLALVASVIPANSAVTLYEDGVARARIVTGPQASERTQLAAAEIAEYLGKMSGADFEVAELPWEGASILVGPRAMEAAGHEVDLTGLGPEGALLKTRAGDVVAAGLTDIGTLNAAYDLLHLLGVRWFMPGEGGEYVPKSATVRVEEIDRAHRPSMSYRLIWSASGRLKKEQAAEYAAWQRRNHMPGALRGSIGHAYDRIVSGRDAKLFEEHPEYYAQVEGKRTNRGQICTTNPAVTDRAIAYARKTLADQPENTMISLSPNDGAGFCRCEACRAEGSSSDNALALANRVGEAIAEEFPDRYVAFYAYAGTSPPPKLSGRENVIVWIATSFIQGGYTLEELIEGWSAKVHQIGIRGYYSVCPWSWQMPRHDPEKIADELRYYHANKARGLSAESEDNFGSRGVNYYVSARLMYDLDQDVGELLEDYYAKCYGAGAPAMKDYWERWRGGANVSRDRLALALRDLERADALAQDEGARRRIARQKAYLHYMRLFREYGQARGEERIERLGEAMKYGYSIGPMHAIHIPNVFYRIVGKPRSRKLEIPEETLAEWMGAASIAAEEVEADFQRDLAQIQPLGVERRDFAGTIAPLEIEAGNGRAAPALRGANEVWVWAPEDGKLRVAAVTGIVRNAGMKLTVRTAAGEDVAAVEIPEGVAQSLAEPLPEGMSGPTVVDVGAGGLFRVAVAPQLGSACRLDFGDVPHAIRADSEQAFTFISGTRGPMSFFVPEKTEAFAVGLRTPDQHGQIVVRGPAGETALQEAGNYVLGEEFRVDVADGQAGKVWTLEITRCEDCSLELIGIPALLSQRGDGLLGLKER